VGGITFCTDPFCGCGCHDDYDDDDGGPPEITGEVGDRAAGRAVYPPDPYDPEDPWDGEHFITRGGDRVERTYALAFVTNSPVSFGWHGQTGDLVEEWTVNGEGVKFLKDGAAVSTIRNENSVSVIPGGTAGVFTLRAECKTPKGVTVTRRTEFRVITITAEPIKGTSDGEHFLDYYNPSGFIVGEDADFRVAFSSGVVDDDVSWEVSEPSVASIQGSSQGKAPRSLRGENEGDAELRVNIVNYAGPQPTFDFRVFAGCTRVPLHFGFVRKSARWGGYYFNDEAKIDTAIAHANQIFRQAGIEFYRASVNKINDPAWYKANGMSSHPTLEMCVNMCTNIHQSGGLEIYMVPAVYDSGHNGALTLSGWGVLIEGKMLEGRLLAHELGHCCGLKDIYTSHEDVIDQVTGPVSRARVPLDWSNGPGPEEYYPHGLWQGSVVYKLLMQGSPFSGGGVDIPRGRVFGLGRTGALDPLHLGLIPVGQDSPLFNPTPFHQ
jgi:hypothetical protein